LDKTSDLIRKGKTFLPASDARRAIAIEVLGSRIAPHLDAVIACRAEITGCVWRSCRREAYGTLASRPAGVTRTRHQDSSIIYQLR
jgi:hypothetical protein